MHMWTVGSLMKAEHGVIFQCFNWPFHLKVMSFKPERSSSKEKVTQKPNSSLCLLPALWEVKCAPCYSSLCTFSTEPQEGILMVQYVVLNRKMDSLALWTHCQKAEPCLYCQKYIRVAFMQWHILQNLSCAQGNQPPRSFLLVLGNLLSHDRTWV